jgi:type IV secretion system protein VirB6
VNIFANFFTWLDARLALWLSTKVAVVAATIEPWAVAMATLYVMVWAWLAGTGRIQEPIMDGVRRILTIAVILGVGIRLGLYNQIFVDSFNNGPNQLGAAIIGASSPVSMIDQIWYEGNLTGQALWNQGGALSGWGYYLAALAVYGVVILVCAATMAFLLLARIVTNCALVLGPLFIVSLFFDSTKNFFERWIATLATYGLLTVVVSVFGSMVLEVVLAFATSAAASGPLVTMAEVMGMAVITIGIGWAMKQSPSISASMTGGIAPTTFNAVSRAVSWGLGTARQTGRGFIEGAAGVPRGKMDSAARLGGSVMGQVARGVFVSGPERQGGTVSRDRVMPPRLVR